jgi:hypothetical protein
VYGGLGGGGHGGCACVEMVWDDVCAYKGTVNIKTADSCIFFYRERNPKTKLQNQSLNFFFLNCCWWTRSPFCTYSPLPALR